MSQQIKFYHVLLFLQNVLLFVSVLGRNRKGTCYSTCSALICCLLNTTTVWRKIKAHFSANILSSDKDLIQPHFEYTEIVLKCSPTDDVQFFVQECGLSPAACFDTEKQVVRLEMKPLLSYCVALVRVMKAAEQQTEPAVRLTGESFSDKNDARFRLFRRSEHQTYDFNQVQMFLFISAHSNLKEWDTNNRWPHVRWKPWLGKCCVKWPQHEGVLARYHWKETHKSTNAVSWGRAGTTHPCVTGFFPEQSRQLCIKFASQLNKKTFCFHEYHRYNKLFAKTAPVCKKAI